jgi:hypothetical protein
MTTLRWLLHSARCAWYRWQARDALDCIEVAQVAQRRERQRMDRALAHEEQEQRAWAAYRKHMREAAQ